MFPSPSLSVPTLSDFQWEFNGLILGADTPFAVLKVEGLDLPEVRNGDTPWPRDHGQSTGLDVYGGNDIIFDLWMKSNGTSLQSSQLELAGASVVRPTDEIPLWIQLPNLPIMCLMCRPRIRKMDITSDYAAADIGEPEFQLHATDPRFYEPGKSEEIKLGTPSDGKVTPGEITVINGNTEMRPTVIFNGPLISPKITNLSIGSHPFIRLVNREKEEESNNASRIAAAAEIEVWRIELLNKFIDEPEFLAKKKAREELLETEEETARDKAEEEEITVKEGDQLVVNFGNPHTVYYYPGGIESGTFENSRKFVTSDSTWWDILPGENKIQLISEDAEDKGKAYLQWAPANMI